MVSGTIKDWFGKSSEQNEADDSNDHADGVVDTVDAAPVQVNQYENAVAMMQGYYNQYRQSVADTSGSMQGSTAGAPHAVMLRDMSMFIVETKPVDLQDRYWQRAIDDLNLIGWHEYSIWHAICNKTKYGNEEALTETERKVYRAIHRLLHYRRMGIVKHSLREWFGYKPVTEKVDESSVTIVQHDLSAGGAGGAGGAGPGQINRYEKDVAMMQAFYHQYLQSVAATSAYMQASPAGAPQALVPSVPVPQAEEQALPLYEWPGPFDRDLPARNLQQEFVEACEANGYFYGPHESLEELHRSTFGWDLSDPME